MIRLIIQIDENRDDPSADFQWKTLTSMMVPYDYPCPVAGDTFKLSSVIISDLFSCAVRVLEVEKEIYCTTDSCEIRHYVRVSR